MSIAYQIRDLIIGADGEVGTAQNLLREYAATLLTHDLLGSEEHHRADTSLTDALKALAKAKKAINLLFPFSDEVVR
jgi:hypothetical protein